jgi:DNA-directed RNA polymerase subunit F
MIVKTILDERYLTLPEVKEILAAISKQKSEEELQYELKRALDHVNTFAKLDAAESRALVNELIDLKKMKEEIAIRIADIAPLSKNELRSIYAKERFTLTEDELEEILDIVAGHF